MIGLAYVLWAGGDFMLGRFLLPPLWALVALLVVVFPTPSLPAAARLRTAAASLAALATATLLTGQTTAVLWNDLEEASYVRAVGFVGATDERRVYIPLLGAYAARHPSMQPRAVQPGVEVVMMLGQNAFFAPHAQRFADIAALSDPFLARIMPLPHGRPGHEVRPTPEAWTLWRDPAYHFADPRLEALAADLRLVHLSGDLWSRARWHAMARLATFGKIDPHALFISGAHDTWRIVGDVTKLFRPFKAPSYVVWIRRHDPGHLAYFMKFPHAIDRDCNPVEVPDAETETTGIAVKAGEPLEIRCPKERLAGDALFMRVGAWTGEGAARHVAYDDGIEVVRPVLGWISGMPDWIVQGWSETPEEALETAFVLLSAAALLLAASRGRARRP